MVTPPKTGTKPPASHGYDSKAGQTQREIESQKIFKAEAPKSSYTTPKGTSQTIDPADKSATKVRNSLDSGRYYERPQRHYTTYTTYYSRPAPTIFYSDPFNHYFYWWMLDRSLDQQALWVYNHHSRIDRERLTSMYAQNKDLEARVKQLEAEKNGVRDESWTPDGMDADMMYTDEYVDAAFNPQVKSAGVSVPWRTICFVVLILLLIGSVTLASVEPEARPVMAPVAVLLGFVLCAMIFSFITALLVMVGFCIGFYVVFVHNFGGAS